MSTATIEQICPECDDHVEDCYCGNVAECWDCGECYEEAELRNYLCPDCYKSRFTCMIHDKPYIVKDWAAWAEYAEHVKSVDFGCQFDCDGKCACTRDDRDMAGYGMGKKVCCVGCASNKGYLDSIPAEALELVKSLFDDEDGFWRPGGCTLPHEYRSYTCLTHTCYSKEREENSDKTGLAQLQNHLDILVCTESIARSKRRLQRPRSEQFGREAKNLRGSEKHLGELLEQQAELEPVEQE